MVLETEGSPRGWPWSDSHTLTLGECTPNCLQNSWRCRRWGVQLPSFSLSGSPDFKGIISRKEWAQFQFGFCVEYQSRHYKLVNSQHFILKKDNATFLPAPTAVLSQEPRTANAGWDGVLWTCRTISDLEISQSTNVEIPVVLKIGLCVSVVFFP